MIIKTFQSESLFSQTLSENTENDYYTYIYTSVYTYRHIHEIRIAIYTVIITVIYLTVYNFLADVE